MATLVGKVVALLLTQVFQKSSQNTTTVRKIPQWVNESTGAHHPFRSWAQKGCSQPSVEMSKCHVQMSALPFFEGLKNP